MAYADFEFYVNEFFSDILTADNAAKWLSLASDELDALTFGRLSDAFPRTEADAVRVRKAVCAVAEALYQIDNQRRAAAAHRTEDGTCRGAVASISSGRERISFASGSASAFASAAADDGARDRLIRGIAVRYLADVPDDNGVNLLYAGVI